MPRSAYRLRALLEINNAIITNLTQDATPFDFRSGAPVHPLRFEGAVRRFSQTGWPRILTYYSQRKGKPLNAIPAGAAQISQFVNCGGATQEQSINGGTAPNLRCDQNGFTAIATYIGPGALEAVAVPAEQGATGPVVARVGADGEWSMTVATTTSRSLFCCLTSSITGSGTGTASGTLGPGSLGQPCDFTHSIPIQSNTPVLFGEHDLVSASSNAVTDLQVRFLFFDQNGSPATYNYLEVNQHPAFRSLPN